MEEFDFSATYVAEGWGAGIAWRASHYVKELVEEAYIVDDETYYEWDEVENKERVFAHMVGDDARFEFGIDELTKIDEDDYCHECGQVGCQHDGRDRSE